VELRWSLSAYEAGVGSDRSRRSPVAEVVDEAVRMRAQATRTRGERMLRRLGVRIEGRAWRAAPPVERPPGVDAGGAAP
jgi:hypothetical protein